LLGYLQVIEENTKILGRLNAALSFIKRVRTHFYIKRGHS